LREDNADVRLTPVGRRLGLVDDRRWQRLDQKHAAVVRETRRLRTLRLRPEAVGADIAEALFGRALERDYSLADLLRRPGVSFDHVSQAAAVLDDGAVSRETLRQELGDWLADSVIEQIQIELKYAGYVQRQSAAVARLAADEDTSIPADFEYTAIQALSHEARQVLSRRRPETLGQAGRLPGITPATVAVLKVFLKRSRAGRDQASARTAA
jgi:tRNA uridine 5-carboxymethylaminomethyl modification enzyme